MKLVFTPLLTMTFILNFRTPFVEESPQGHLLQTTHRAHRSVHCYVLQNQTHPGETPCFTATTHDPPAGDDLAGASVSNRGDLMPQEVTLGLGYAGEFVFRLPSIL